MSPMRLVYALLATLVLVASAFAQTENATVAGRVSDSSGAAVAGADVTIQSIERGTNRTQRTNEAGVYVFTGIQPGQYRMAVSREGFRQVDLLGLIVNVQDRIDENFRLQVGSVAESVTVEANSTSIDISGTVGTVIDQQILHESPLNGRSFQPLFQLTPGVVVTPTNFADQGQFSVNGQRADTNYFTIDGASANAGVGAGGGAGQAAAGAQPALTAAGGTNGLVSIDAVQEFAIQTSSFAPEYGRTPGAQVSIVTKSGTNAFHANVFDYLRNDIFDANDWFADHDGLKKPALRQNDFGGTLGGPIFKDRTFFFFSYEGLRLRQPTVGVSDVPSIATRQAAPAQLQPFLDAYPLPTGADEGNGLAPAIYGFSNPSTLNATSLRVDHHFTPSLSAFARYNYAPSSTQSRGNFASLNSVTDTSINVQTLTLGLSAAATRHVANYARFNWTRTDGGTQILLDSFGGAQPFNSALVIPPPFSPNDSFAGLFLGFGTNAAVQLGRNSANSQRQINVIDNVSWQVGSHVVKFGVDYRRLTPHIGQPVYGQEAFFTSAASLISDTPAFSLVFSDVPADIVFNNYSLYAQDSWATSPRLNITFGLRWDYNPTPTGHSPNGLTPLVVRGLNDPSTATFAPNGTPIYKASIDNFAPRLGFAYQLRAASGREAIMKGGAGMFYDTGSGAVPFAFFFAPFQVTNFTVKPFPLTGSDAAPLPVTGAPPFSFGLAFPPRLRQPYTYHWNLAFEQALGGSQSLSLGYVGAAAHSLERTTQYLTNLPPAFSGGFEAINNNGYSNYNALQAQFRRRSPKGFDLTSSYTFAHALDNGSTFASIVLPSSVVSPSSDYGPADFDVRHTGTLALAYDLPSRAHGRLGKSLLNGWGIAPVLTARSATPVDVVVTRTVAFGTYNFRPDLAPGSSLYLYDSSLPGGRSINPGAFRVSPQTQQGNLQRNALRAFPLVQLDMAVRRRFALTEHLGLDARLEAFNIFNHPNFAPPQTTLGDVSPNGVFTPQSGFGVSQSMLGRGLQGTSQGIGFNPLYQIGGPRSLQLALKLEF